MKYAHWEWPRGRSAEIPGVPPLVARVLSARGVADAAQARELLRTDEGLLCDPWLMADMDKAVGRIRTALDKGEIIAVYGDYDVDGVTSTCLLYDFLQSLGGKVLWHIPRRLEEGYGLNVPALEALARDGAKLVVTVDCGVTAEAEVDYARSLGLDVVITDHHACKDTLPGAVAVVNPQRPDCPYPFKKLAGVGVAMKLAMAMGCPFERYADLAALGTVADVMPLTGENRAIAAHGVERIQTQPRPGLRALLEAVDHQGSLTAVTLGYTLSPRLNAAGRLGLTDLSVQLLLARSLEEARPLAAQLCELNRRRQELEGDIFELCRRQLEAAGVRDAIVLSGEGWHQGVVGIVASRLADQYTRPAFVISVEKGMGKGSCRGAAGLSVFQGLSECADLLEEYGGHAMAAGFTVREEHIPALKERLDAWARRDARREEPTLQADCLLEDGSLLTVENIHSLSVLEPFGTGNPKPLFILPRCTLLGASRVGATGRHMRLRVQEGERRFSCIFFSFPEGWDLRPDDRVDLAFTPQINEYQGQRSVQLVLTDLRRTPTRGEAERWVFQRYRRGETLTAQEAPVLLPTRKEFEALWRCIQARAPLTMESAVNLSRQVGRLPGGSESYAKTMIGLEVFHERGLIELDIVQEQVNLRLCPPGARVDLEASPIMVQLRRWAEGIE